LNVVAWPPPSFSFISIPIFHNIPTSGVCRTEFRRRGLKT
jgi:hypothetical protein